MGFNVSVDGKSLEETVVRVTNKSDIEKKITYLEKIIIDCQAKLKIEQDKLDLFPKE